MKTIALLLLISCFPLTLFAQKHDQNWMLGDSCGIRFENNGEIHSVSPRISYYDAWKNTLINTTFNDKDGSLLGYINPICTGSRYCYYEILDKDNNKVENGDSLKTTVADLHSNCVLYIRDTIYFFHMGLEPHNQYLFRSGNTKLGCHLYLTTLIQRNNNLVVLKKNQLILENNLTSGIATVKHSHASKWWILVHNIDDAKTYSYLFNKGVLTRKESISNEMLYGIFSNNTNITFSPSGKKICILSSCGYIEIFDFDRCTGEITSIQYIGREKPYTQEDRSTNIFFEDGFYHCCFSSNDEILYFGPYYRLIQFDLSNSSAEVLYSSADSANIYRGIYRLEYTPRGQIFLSSFDLSNTSDLDSIHTIGIIEYPDRLGQNCRFNINYLKPECKNSHNTQPHFPNYRLGPAPGYEDFGARPGPPQTICHNADPVQLGGSPLPREATYRWLPETGLDDPFSPNPLAAPDTTTTYTLIVEQCHVSDTATVTVTVLPELAAEAGTDTILCPGGRVRLGPPNRSRNLEYAWRPATGLDFADRANPLAAPTRTTTYTLTVLRPGECDTLASDTVRLEVDELCGTGRVFLPNAFSPNNDGVNDELTVFHENLSSFHLRIYNRWGQLVYETREPDAFWRGGNASEGVYSYVLEVATEDGRRLQRKGTVTLTR